MSEEVQGTPAPEAPASESPEVQANVQQDAVPQRGSEVPPSAEVSDVAKSEFKPKNSDFARQFSALSRRERELRQREARIKEAEEKYKSQPGDDWKVRMRTEPLKVLEEAGVSLDYLAQVAADDGRTPDEAKLYGVIQQQQRAMQELQERLDRFEQGQQASQEEQQLQQFVNGIADHVNSDREKYKAIIAQDAVQLVYDVIEQDFDSKVSQGEANPTILSYSEAADLVEDYLREQARQQAEALGLYSPPAAPQGQGAPETAPGSKPSHTLSNEHSTQAPTHRDPSALSDEDRFNRALEQLKFND